MEQRRSTGRPPPRCSNAALKTQYSKYPPVLNEGMSTCRSINPNYGNTRLSYTVVLKRVKGVHCSWSGKGIYVVRVCHLVWFSRLTQQPPMLFPTSRYRRAGPLSPWVDRYLKLSCVRSTVQLVYSRAGRDSSSARLTNVGDPGVACLSGFFPRKVRPRVVQQKCALKLQLHDLVTARFVLHTTPGYTYSCHGRTNLLEPMLASITPAQSW